MLQVSWQNVTRESNSFSTKMRGWSVAGRVWSLKQFRCSLGSYITDIGPLGGRKGTEKYPSQIVFDTCHFGLLRQMNDFL